MSRHGLVSIIVPNYNSSSYIAETIDSVIAQSYQNWELLIVDDCSSDDSCSIINAYASTDTRIKLIKLPQNSGRPAVPRNIGLKLAEGKFIAFLDSDDVWHPFKIELQVDMAKRYGCGFVASSLKTFYGSGEIKDDLSKPIDVQCLRVSAIGHRRLLRKNLIANSSVLVSREFIKRQEFEPDIRYRAIEDFHMWLRLLQEGGVCIKIDAPLLFYRLSDTSISRSKWSMFLKQFMLYREYRFKGALLGPIRFLYIFTYVVFSFTRYFGLGYHKVAERK